MVYGELARYPLLVQVNENDLAFDKIRLLNDKKTLNIPYLISIFVWRNTTQQ